MRKGGLEPPWVTPQDPKSCVSTSFTTFARDSYILYPLIWINRLAGSAGRLRRRSTPGPEMRQDQSLLHVMWAAQGRPATDRTRGQTPYKPFRQKIDSSIIEV